MAVEFPVQVSAELSYAASLWHDGQWSSLYSLSSTGKIHSWEQINGLEVELNRIFRDNTHAPYMIECEEQLRELQGIVEKLVEQQPEDE